MPLDSTVIEHPNSWMWCIIPAFSVGKLLQQHEGGVLQTRNNQISFHNHNKTASKHHFRLVFSSLCIHLFVNEAKTGVTVGVCEDAIKPRLVILHIICKCFKTHCQDLKYNIKFHKSGWSYSRVCPFSSNESQSARDQIIVDRAPILPTWAASQSLVKVCCNDLKQMLQGRQQITQPSAEFAKQWLKHSWFVCHSKVSAYLCCSWIILHNSSGAGAHRKQSQPAGNLSKDVYCMYCHERLRGKYI